MFAKENSGASVRIHKANHTTLQYVNAPAWLVCACAPPQCKFEMAGSTNHLTVSYRFYEAMGRWSQTEYTDIRNFTRDDLPYLDTYNVVPRPVRASDRDLRHRRGAPCACALFLGASVRACMDSSCASWCFLWARGNFAVCRIRGFRTVARAEAAECVRHQ